jgi:hypothetical protein
MDPLCSCLLLAGLLTTALGAPLALDNGKIRIELEPRTFSVRFIGLPGGNNFLEPAHLTQTELAGTGWLDPGGLFTDVLPVHTDDAALRRGPAEVLERRDDYVLLLGPEHPVSRWRVKKEVQLVHDAAELTYKVTVLSSLKEERDIRIRTTARLDWSGALIVPVAPGRMSLVRGAYQDVLSLLEFPEETYTVPLRSKKLRTRAVLSSASPEVTMTTDFGKWKRRLEIRSALPEPEAENRIRMLALLDDPSHTYESALEGAQSGTNVGSPFVVVEHWSVSPPAPKGTSPRSRDEDRMEVLP